MVKQLKFSNIQCVERRGALMLVSFLDDDQNLYNWAPKWNDIREIFRRGINVERFNKPESDFLNQFAQTVKQVVEGAQRIDSAYKTAGTFERYQNQKMFLSPSHRGGIEEIIPGFEVTINFLDEWMGRYVDVFVINDVAIRIRYGDEEYPPPELEEIPDEDLPFRDKE